MRILRPAYACRSYLTRYGSAIDFICHALIGQHPAPAHATGAACRRPAAGTSNGGAPRAIVEPPALGDGQAPPAKPEQGRYPVAGKRGIGPWPYDSACRSSWLLGRYAGASRPAQSGRASQKAYPASLLQVHEPRRGQPKRLRALNRGDGDPGAPDPVPPDPAFREVPDAKFGVGGLRARSLSVNPLIPGKGRRGRPERPFRAQDLPRLVHALRVSPGRGSRAGRVGGA